MAGAPEIAVVVGDYSRRRYLPFALRSLAAQTLPRGRFEIVVTKNWHDPAIDRSLEDLGARVLFDEETRIGRWLRRAVSAARAPIVTFLDDDDEYEPGRLARILEVFSAHPDLGFYRNRVRVIDRDGRPTPPAAWRAHEVDAAFDTLGPVYLEPGETARTFDLAARRTHITFNSSTMAIRRELLEGALGDDFSEGQLPDLSLFLAGVLSHRALFLDDQRLTRFRYYRDSVTHETPWLGRAESSFRAAAGSARRHGRPDFARWLEEMAVHYGRMYRGSELVERIVARGPRREVAQRTAEYLRLLGRHPTERAWTLDTWAAAGYGLAYLGVPTLTAQLAHRRLRARGLSA